MVDTITWTATGDTQIAPGEFQLFWISAGQMPTDVDELTFPAVQTYSSGEEVAWIDTAAPVAPSPSTRRRACSWRRADAGSTAATSSDSDDGDDSGNALAIVALVVAAAGLAVAVVALVLSRRGPAAA